MSVAHVQSVVSAGAVAMTVMRVVAIVLLVSHAVTSIVMRSRLPRTSTIPWTTTMM